MLHDDSVVHSRTQTSYPFSYPDPYMFHNLDAIVNAIVQ